MIKKKPTSPGLRGMVSTEKHFFNFLKKKKLLKTLVSKSGRNNQGKITTRHKGGGVKRKYRIINFNYNKLYIKAKIKSIEYDPNRNANISMILYSDGEYKYNLNIKGSKVGDNILSGYNITPNNANAMILKNIPMGLKICCIENFPNSGAIYSRSAGTYSKIISKKDGSCLIKMSSGVIKNINSNCFATIGEISNGDYYLRKIGKAGIKRKKGIRPTVRGVAMNPVDHPHGGGEGKTSTKRHPVNFKGKLTKGYKTVKKYVKII
ncbi:50S ribosomal protein L2 [Candidatus Vidania fulgoroideorum]